MTLEILTPDRKVYEGEASSVTLPGTLGQFEILNHHAPVISTLEDGKVIVRGGSAKEEIFMIKGGVVEASNNNVVILAEGIQQK